jgi:hypothetical protein
MKGQLNHQNDPTLYMSLIFSASEIPGAAAAHFRARRANERRTHLQACMFLRGCK